MKKILVSLLIASTVTLSGCQAMKENPALGIGIGVAAGAVAASVAANHHDKHKDDDRKDNDQWDRDEHRDRADRHHHRNHDNGVVYRDGRKGYEDAYGNFHAY